MHFLVFLLWVFSGRLVLGNVSFLPIGFLECVPLSDDVLPVVKDSI